MSLWRVEEAAEYLGIRPKTLYEWVRSGRVPHRKIGFNVRFDREEIEAWVADQSRHPDTDDASTSPDDATPASAAPGTAPGHAAVEETTRFAPRSSAIAVEIEELRDACCAAVATLRRLQQELGTHLSFPERQQIARLADRLERAATAVAPDERPRRG